MAGIHLIQAVFRVPLFWHVLPISVFQPSVGVGDDAFSHRHLDCLLDSLSRLTSKTTRSSAFLVLCEDKPLVTDEFSSQRASNAKSVSMCRFVHVSRPIPQQWDAVNALAFSVVVYSSQWCHNERDGISNHRRFDCLLNRLFKRSKKTQSSASLVLLRRNYRCWVDSLHNGCNAENVSIWWRYHGGIIAPVPVK